MKKALLTSLCLIFIYFSFSQNHQPEQIPSTFEGKHHMLSPDELTKNNNNYKAFSETPPPEGGGRNIAEWEPNQGVVVRGTVSWGSVQFGIPLHLIASFSQDVKVYVICANETQSSSITSEFVSNDVNMDNIEYIIGPSDSYWTRDFTPWFIEYGENNDIGFINFPYNRPRPNDNDVPILLGDYFNKQVFGMAMEHTGGNFMSDGIGIGASCDLVYSENSNLSHDEIQDMAYDYLGLTNYYLVSDPLDDYIEHIDCWGKFLAPDKILMGEVAPTDYRYDDFEAMADFWANQTSSYGNKFKVYRTYSPNGQPYTNSLILNKKVYVPIVSGTGSEHNSNALEVYQNALPGYEIIGVENNTNTPWEGTDALHCRTYQVPDFEMLRISHLPILDTVDFQDSYEINADIYTLSISENIIEDAFLNYNINDGDYNLINLNNIDGSLYSANITNINENDKVCYYLEATNTNDKHEMHPITGENNPHCFYVRTSVNNDIAKIESQIKAFPNPVYDRLSITVNNLSNEDCRLQIIDINGKIILEKNVSILNNWERISIDLSEIDSGLYFVRLLGNNIARSQRFIKL